MADAVAKGAKVLCGGAAPEGPGFYYPPTVLAGITPEMRLYREEVFGPVASLYRVADIDEAIELANGTEFGLGANAWTNDGAERSRFIRDLVAGMVFVNGNVTSYPQLPFGGVRTSGFGRELSYHGIREFCNAKTVWIGPAVPRRAAILARVPRPHRASRSALRSTASSASESTPPSSSPPTPYCGRCSPATAHCGTPPRRSARHGDSRPPAPWPPPSPPRFSRP